MDQEQQSPPLLPNHTSSSSSSQAAASGSGQQQQNNGGPPGRRSGAGSGSSGKRQRGAKPQKMNFMFIDSSDHGTNAKPDKAVRSFVMHQARRSKTWSTRQKEAASASESASASPNSLETDQDQPPEEHDASEAGESLLFQVAQTQTQTQSQIRTKRQSQNQPKTAATGPGAKRAAKANKRNAGPPPASSTPSPPYAHSEASISSASTSKHSRHSTPASSVESLGVYDHRGGELYKTAHHAFARQDGFALGVMDPFDCLAVRMDSRTSAMLDHFVSMISPRLLPVDLHHSSNIVCTQWVANSLQHATSAPFTYALLTSSALLLSMVGGCQLQDVLFYKARAITEINLLLSDPRTRIDDCNITAVFILLTLEEFQLAPGSRSSDDADWSELQRQIHLEGLKTMIRQRGGLKGLASNRCLQVFILMHSTAHSISTFTPPYTGIYPTEIEPPSPSTQTSPHLSLFTPLNPPPTLLSILADLSTYNHDLESWYTTPHSPLDPLDLQKRGCLLNSCFLSWYLASESASQSATQTSPATKAQTAIHQSLALTSILYLAKITQPFDPSHRAILHTAVKKLRHTLCTSLSPPSFSPAHPTLPTTLTAWTPSPAALLWTLTLGALAATPASPESSFFARTFGVALRDFEIRNANHALEEVKRCFWIEYVLDGELEVLWGMLAGVRREDAGGPRTPEVREDEVVGMLTGARFFGEGVVGK